MHWANQDVRRRFLACFSNAELMSLVQAIQLKLGRTYSVTTTTMHENFPWNDVLRFVRVISTRPFKKKDVELLDVFQLADIIKRWVEENEARKMKNASPSPIINASLPPLFPKRDPLPEIPPFPRDLLIDHPTIGCVEVTEHAWERFCERFCQPYETLEAAQLRLQGTLRNATTQTDVSPAMRVRRIISSNFKRARYLIDEGLEARFVLAVDKNVLLTVEQAYER